MNNFSFAVTAYEETSAGRLEGRRICECLEAPQAHEQIGEIVISDDGSSDFNALVKLLVSRPKVQFFRCFKNRGVFTNKIQAVGYSTGDWVITCDSDNRMDAAFINRAIEVAQDPDCWYCPSFAREHFDYRGLIGEYDLAAIGTVADLDNFQACMNTGNQTVHRNTFMEVFGRYLDKRFDLVLPNYLDLPEHERLQRYWRLVWDACDSFLLNLLWLRAGKRIAVVKGLEYWHYWTNGPESNYIRSPKEKDKLNAILLRELLEDSERAAGVHLIR